MESQKLLLILLVVFSSFGVVFSSGWHPAGEILTGNFTGYYDFDHMPSVENVPLQIRVGGSCSAGSSIRAINSDGTVECEDDDTGVGCETDPVYLASDAASVTSAKISN